MSKKTAALEAAMLEYGRYIQAGEGSTRAVERAIEIYNYVNESVLQPSVDRYAHDHKDIEIMPGQIVLFDAGDQPIHKALTRPIAQHVDSFPKIPLASQELTPQILNKMIEAHLVILRTALLEANQIAGEAMDYACDNDAVQKIYAKTSDALAAWNKRFGDADGEALQQ